MKNLILLVLLFATFLSYSQDNDTYSVIIDGKEVFINGTTGQIVGNSSTVDIVQNNSVEVGNESVNTSKEPYKIQAGDTFYKLARRHNTTVERLYEINGFSSDHVLLVGTSIFVEKKRKVITVASRSNSNAVSLSSDEHTVKRGETLYSIAKRYKTTVERLQKLNNLRNNAIFVNQKLRLK